MLKQQDASSFKFKPNNSFRKSWQIRYSQRAFLRVGKSPLGDLGVKIKTNNNKLPKYNKKFVTCVLYPFKQIFTP